MDTRLVYKDAKILIVDDQDSNIELLERILRRAGYSEICTTTFPTQVIPIYHDFQPDIILLDLHMPEMDGRELLQHITPLVSKPAVLPILVLTADISSKTKQEALLLGASDFLTKPIDKVEVLLRIRNLLQTRFLSLANQHQTQILEAKITEKTTELQLSQLAMIESLAKATQYRDDYTGEHAKRVGRISGKMALALGFSKEEADMIGLASSLHDIGKIGIPDDILMKPERLTTKELDIMESHTSIGKDIISNTHFPLLSFAHNIAYTHHERWDGTGYPNGLKGNEIPLEGQIVSIVDVYDNLTHGRPHKATWSSERAILEITRQKGKQFGPKIVSTFLKVIMEYQ